MHTISCGSAARFGVRLLLALFVSTLAGCVTQQPAIPVSANVVTMKNVDGFFVTDRAQSDETSDEPFFSELRGDVVFGRATVDVPVSQPSAADAGLRKYGNRRIRNAVVQQIVEQDMAEFFASLRNEVATNPRRELLLFVHGYNTSFDEAMRRVAQVVWDTRFAGPPVLFSWPSKKGVTSYTADEANVHWATTHLYELLGQIVSEAGAERIVLMAHSMGARALTDSIIRLERERGPQASIRHIVLAAPDIDADVFVRDIAPGLVRSDRSVTLYASSRDRALELSEQLHAYPRAGDSGSRVVVYPGVDTIDATDVDASFLGHNYYGENLAIMTDLDALLNDDMPASERPGLQAEDADDGGYWLMVAPEQPETN